jgi:Flp pilus assembly protein TadG
MSILKKASNENGGTLVEFAIVVPLLLILIFGIIDFGIILYDKAVITNASREGARYGILARDPELGRHTQTEIEQLLIDQGYWDRLVTFEGEANPIVTATPNPDTNFGSDLVVQVAWSYTFLAFNVLPGIGFDNTIDLSARTVMKYE